MSVDIGIIGPAGSGKTTVFNALTKGKADTGGYLPEGSAPHIGIARVPEPRLQILADILHPKRVVAAEARYTFAKETEAVDIVFVTNAGLAIESVDVNGTASRWPHHRTYSPEE